MSAIRQGFRKIGFLRNSRTAGQKLATLARDLPKWERWRRRSRAAPGNGPDTLHIAFVTGYSKARVFKLAHATTLVGHRVSLVSLNVEDDERALRYFNSHENPQNPWEVLEFLEDLRPDVVHLFVNYDNFDMLPVLRFAPAPVVYDPYDCMKGMLNPRYQKDWLELRSEKHAFARAAHVCSRSLEPLFLKRRFGYEMPGVTYFPEYCWQEPLRREPRRVSDDELHVVYCGGLLPEDRFSQAEYGYIQFIEVGRILAAQRLHLHIYPAVPRGLSNFDDFYSLYIKESETSKYFHFHHPLPYDQLTKRFSEYDAALHVLGAGVGSGRVTRDKLDYSMANKLFDYIEAGLPVIIHQGKHQVGLVRHYGTAVPVSSLQDIRPAIVQALGRAREQTSRCDLAFHAPRLSDMYRGVVSRTDPVGAGLV